jgi:hypothetical protein
VWQCPGPQGLVRPAASAPSAARPSQPGTS